MRLGQIVKYRGDTVKVVSINDDGTLTLAHVSSSGKKGFAGKIAAPNNTVNGLSPVPLNVYKTETGERATVSLEQYNSYTEPINNAAISQLDSLRVKYFSSAEKDVAQLNEILTNMRAVSTIVGANFQDVLEGRCGIEECQFQHRGGMAPSHYPSTGCQSGQVPHCTCDACF
jgi:hypothetical protein